MEAKNNFLSSRITLEASLISNMHRLKSTLSFYPNIKPLSEGSVCSYIIDNGSMEDRFYIINIEKNRLTVTLNSKDSPFYFSNEFMLRILSIILVLSKDYKVDMNGLMPFLIQLLSRGRIAEVERKNVSIEATNANIILSRRIVELLKENMQIERRLKNIDSELIMAISRLIAQKQGIINLDSLSVEFGVSRESVSNAVAYMKSNGYRFIKSSNGNFEVMRI